MDFFELVDRAQSGGFQSTALFKASGASRIREHLLWRFLERYLRSCSFLPSCATAATEVSVKPVVILYATREGHTRRIAEHVAEKIRSRGIAVDVLDVASRLPGDFALEHYAGAVVAASVHIGKHEREMIKFVKRQRSSLEAMPTGFLSVSLAQAGAEDLNATRERRQEAAANVSVVIDAFLRDTQWKPTRVRPVAGALLYRQYGTLVRLVMRFIAKRAGGATDISRDHEYTDWAALDRFADEIASLIANGAKTRN